MLRIDWLKKELQKKENINLKIKLKYDELVVFSIKLYEKGYSGLDLMYILENPGNLKITGLTENKRYELLFALNKIRKEFRNEKLFIMFILNFIFLSLDYSLENISFM